MPKWIYATNGNGANGILAAQGVTLWLPLSGGTDTNGFTTEAFSQVTLRGSYTASNLWLQVETISGTCTIRTRKNGVNGAQLISVTTTGTKEDTTNTDSLADGNTFSVQASMSNTHTNSCRFRTCSVLLDDSGGNIPIIVGATPDANEWTTSAVYATLGGNISASTTESNAQTTFRSSGTLSNFSIYASGNTFTATTTYRTRVNGANGNQAVSLTASETGSKEDVSNTDAVGVGDEVCFGKDSGGTSGTATIVRSSFKMAASAVMMMNTDTDGRSIVVNANDYRTLSASFITANSTEGFSQVKARIAETFKNMQCNVIANGRLDATTADFRAGAASPGGGPSISIAAGSTGIKEDLTGTYDTAVADLINYRISTGSDPTGSITFSTIGCQQGAGPAADVVVPVRLFRQPGQLGVIKIQANSPRLVGMI